ncbi:hypothetical protein KEM48_003896 [Puccinia striiformis f. sp. tritici PST-130]|nr:hypothetical protein KEM48_003896 [Puccinia striiformis f. sp. tritici PST-130]
MGRRSLIYLFCFRYLRALAAFYVRLTFTSINVYQTLEPLLQDYRKLRVRGLDGTYDLTTFDELIDNLLTESIVFEIVLPRLTSRKVLEDLESLPEQQEQDQEEEKIELVRQVIIIVIDSCLVHLHRTKTDQDTDNPDQPHHSPTARSQSDRFISRSPSLDRFVSRSPTPEPERVEGDL